VKAVALTNSVPLPIDRALQGLDVLRLRSFRSALSLRALRSVLVERDRRLGVAVAVHACVTFALAVYFPVLLFVLGPVLFGVAHVAADVRYLVIRPRLSRLGRAALAGGCVLFLATSAVDAFHRSLVPARLELGLAGVWAVLAVVAGASRRRIRHALTGLAVVAAVSGVALARPSEFRLVYAHAHNLVGLLAWPLFFRKRLRLLQRVVFGALVAAVVLASGVFSASTLASAGVSMFRVHVLQVALWLAPFERTDWAVGATSAFVFLQALHYSMWLTVVPQGALPGEGTQSFARSAQSLLADFKPWGLAVVAACALAVLFAAFANPGRAAATYLRLATFHGYLELAALLHVWVRGYAPCLGVRHG